MIKYLPNILLLVALVLFIAAFLEINKNNEIASFMLTACGVIIACISVINKNKMNNEKQLVENKLTVIERIKDFDSLLRVILQTMFIFLVFGIILGIFGEYPTQIGGLYKSLAHNNGIIFTNILYGAITGAVVAIGLILTLLIYFLLIFAGIILGIYTFRIKHKLLIILYGMISSVLGLAIIFTISYKAISLTQIANKSVGLAPMGIGEQYALVIGATIMGALIGARFGEK